MGPVDIINSSVFSEKLTTDKKQISSTEKLFKNRPSFKEQTTRLRKNFFRKKGQSSKFYET